MRFNPEFISLGVRSANGRLPEQDTVSGSGGLLRYFVRGQAELFGRTSESEHEMKLTLVLGICVLSASLGCALAVAQQYAASSGPPPAHDAAIPTRARSAGLGASGFDAVEFRRLQ